VRPGKRRIGASNERGRQKTKKPQPRRTGEGEEAYQALARARVKADCSKKEAYQRQGRRADGSLVTRSRDQLKIEDKKKTQVWVQKVLPGRRNASRLEDEGTTDET